MSGVRCGGDTPLAGNETCHAVALHQPHPPACDSPPGHADPHAALSTADRTRRTPEANHRSHPSPPRRPGSRPPRRPLPSGQDQTGVAACRRNTQTVTPPPPNTPSSPGSLRPSEHRQSDTTSPLRLPHPQRHSSSFRAHAPVRSPAFSRTRLPQPLPLTGPKPLPLTPVDPILTYPVPQRRVINAQLVGDLADRLARAANNLHRVTFELIGELPSRSIPSQQDSFPTRCVHSRTSNALFVEVSGHRGELHFSRYDKLDVIYIGFITFVLIIEALRSVNRPYVNRRRRPRYYAGAVSGSSTASTRRCPPRPSLGSELQRESSGMRPRGGVCSIQRARKPTGTFSRPARNSRNRERTSSWWDAPA